MFLCGEMLVAGYHNQYLYKQ